MRITADKALLDEALTEKVIGVFFRGVVVGEYRADLVVEDRLILELKALAEIASIHEVQLVNYLKATRIPLGLILNFGPKPGFKRKIFTQ